ncbi:MAG: GNAT family N-acetyltransferase [Solirubrobacteraceae bacterium]
MPAIPPLSQPLSDESVGLRFTAERDIPEILIAYQDDPQLHIRIGMRRPPSGAELGQELEEAAAERAQGIRASLAILDLPSDEFRGEITVRGIEWDQARASLGVWVAPGARDRGLARRALRLAARWLFDACGLERVALLTDPDNEPMLRAARAAGFQDEGLLRSYGRERSIRGDMAVLSLLPSDLQPSGPAVSVQRTPGSRG